MGLNILVKIAGADIAKTAQANELIYITKDQLLILLLYTNFIKPGINLKNSIANNLKFVIVGACVCGRKGMPIFQ